MKNLACVGLLILLAALTVSCSANPTIVAEPSPSQAALITPEPTSDPAESIQFKDAAFELKVRVALEKPSGSITAEDAKAVRKLDLSNQSFDYMSANPDEDVWDIADLQYFPQLESLNLSYNRVIDLSPLSLVPSLEELGLTGIRATSFAPLEHLTKLRFLTIQWIYDPGQSYPGLKSLDVLAGMQDLEGIDIKGCGLVDISALGPLPRLWSALLTDNEITDVRALALVKNLREVELRNNPITDFSPLAGIYDKLQGKDFELD
jgi:Leucine-rich repeat (LRR) protein